MDRHSHHADTDRLVRSDGMPIDYVNPSARTQPWDQSGNCMSQTYRRHCVGTAPERWNKVATPSLAIIRNGRRHVVEHRAFRRGQTVSKVSAKVDHGLRYEERMARYGANTELAAE